MTLALRQLSAWYGDAQVVRGATLTVNAGDVVDVTIAWSGLTAATPYLGWVEYPGGGTIVSLNP